MKVVQDKTKFNPIVITIESQYEQERLLDILDLGIKTARECGETEVNKFAVDLHNRVLNPHVYKDCK